jgi:hypothetical protein
MRFESELGDKEKRKFKKISEVYHNKENDNAYIDENKRIRMGLNFFLINIG